MRVENSYQKIWLPATEHETMSLDEQKQPLEGREGKYAGSFSKKKEIYKYI